jgi:DNA-binding NarL/FixJ family response regulator
MNRLFVLGDDAAVEHATRFAGRYSSGVNLFAVADGEGSIREAVREARPDIAVVVGTENAETAARHVREVAEEAPSALVLVLAAQSEDGEVLDEVCHAAAFAAAALASEQHDLDSVAGAPTGTPSGAPVNGNGGGAATTSTTRNGAAAEQIAREQEKPAGPWPLTSREREVLCAAAEGHSNAQIGRQLWVTEQTVKFHLSNIYRKLGVSNRTEASRCAIVRGIVPRPGSVHEPAPARAAVMAR